MARIVDHLREYKHSTTQDQNIIGVVAAVACHRQNRMDKFDIHEAGSVLITIIILVRDNKLVFHPHKQRQRISGKWETAGGGSST